MMQIDRNTYSPSNHHPFQLFPQQSLDGNSNTNNTFSQSTSLSTLDTAAAAIAATQRYRTPATPSTQQSFDGGNNSQSLSQVPDLMPSDAWMLHSSQPTPRPTHRFNHQRESSLSSLGSNGPASPYNGNTSNPHIAVQDSGNDGYHDIGGGENTYTYSMGKPMSIGQHMPRDVSSVDGLSNLANQQQQKQRGDRGLAPAPELSIGGGNSSARSHPVSVASSVAGDSPATPSFHESEDDCRRARNVFHTQQVPKLDRTMTDIYSDELYSPNFTITSASPPPQTQMAMSPSNDLFAQRLQAANSQHLSAVQSPVSSTSRDDQSPFRQGSPYASVLGEFPQVGVEQMQHIGSARQINQRLKAERDDKELQQHMARNSAQQQGTPNTISPKDALLDFNESDDGSSIPLFQPHEINSYNMEPTKNGTTNAAPRTISQQSSPSFQSMASTPIQAAFNFSMPSNIQLPQQYPFLGHRHQQQQHQQQSSTPAPSTYSRVSSAEASNSEGGDVPSQKPAGASADGGTYTCTYHGCTLRFETPQLLQRHKREGHRQANALSHIRSPINTSGLPGSMLNSQAGPHKCERTNPSTGKPCNTIFSRPYDLTRHEDTIHNARKQKVRCDLCTEEKTFSRADALTRHYRVCHPDVEFPGKHRRRGGGAA
ncbi:uncharacterized protein F4812DRAFT_449797 [Daldinia caldariorum]|uniref:uncharacterized protein n=1 Tax=Daldinia caldariorum TaxID=326644 RepID=UPI0020074CD1|nr:uncharacterized protein F4812DRAFT_449797 [Daldinia caldariorum]KAI1472030.1 hypothetical protein F4812DRAFT_449797 [Daldinia caldariorum]